jgi:glycosyltransferase involved in cell wall biosynthesis
MIFLVHSETESGNIVENLGASEYSYFFVLKAFRPLLEEIGLVVAVSDPAEEVDRIFSNAARHGEACMFLTFSPPHRSFVPLHCPCIPVFAWEFDTLPTESWNDDPRHDWRTVLRQTGRAITHSQFAVRTTRLAMGESFPVVSLPAPVWDGFAPLYDPAAPAVKAPHRLLVRGRLFDTRSLDLAPHSSAVRRVMGPPALPEQAGSRESLHEIELQGVVYSTVLCPLDGRKNWFDMICGFCLALREAADATLVLKLTHHDCAVAILAILADLAKLPAFSCRVILIDGYLPDESYMRLTELSSYTVNTSHGEGQCLPLMEYMSAGKPAITPNHTAMADYVTAQNAFILASTYEPAIWPHDPREAMRTKRQRLNFETLLAAYRESYAVAKHDPARYAAMAAAAHEGLRLHCAQAKIRAGLREFLLTVPVAA